MSKLVLSLSLAWILNACGDDAATERTTDGDATATTTPDTIDDATADVAATGATDVAATSATDVAATSATDSQGDAPDTPVDPGLRCVPLPPPTGDVIHVTPAQVDELTSIVAGASEGQTILLADGTYPLDGAYLWIDTPGVTLRSASGDREAVILDGGYTTTEIITIAASNVTVAELTIRRAQTHPIHVTTTGVDVVGTRIHGVHVVDPREQAIKINPGTAGGYPDAGEIACSRLELTDAGRPHVNPTSGGCYTGGVDAHQARGWVIRDNEVEGFWCDDGLAEHAIHLWRGSRDTVVERNVLRDNARGVGFGLASSGDARAYADAPCPAAGQAYVDHYGGIIRNNVVFARRAELFASAAGFDCGICLWSACNARVVHNSIVSTGDNFASLEWRFAGAVGITIANNAATHPLRERDGASAALSGNLEGVDLALFVDGAAGDLHLAPGSAAIDQGGSVAAGVCDDDMDGAPRDDGRRDVGADEWGE